MNSSNDGKGVSSEKGGSGGGKVAAYTGTNSSGNDYTNHSDGSYSYVNKSSSGQPASFYYNDGKGHALYTETFHSNSNAARQGQPSRWYEDQNKGYRVHY